MLAALKGGRPVSMPILVYKIYVDGHEELVRGMRFRGFTVRSLKDILAAGDDSVVFEYMDNTAPFALIGGAGFTVETCVVAPSILVDDLDRESRVHEDVVGFLGVGDQIEADMTRDTPDLNLCHAVLADGHDLGRDR